MQSALERALADLALSGSVRADDPASVRAWLDRNDVAPEDADAILEAGVAGLLVYRRLVRGNFVAAMEAMMPRVVTRLGSVFDEYLDAFLRERAPRTHYLRDVAFELLDYCAPRWPEDERVPDYMMDLAVHETVQIEVGSMAPRHASDELGELSLDKPLRFIEAVRIVHYRYAVHRLSEDEDDRTEPERRDTSLLVYRSPEHEVRFLELTALAADILEQLVRGTPLGSAVTHACERAGTRPDQNVLEGTARVLADLADRGALLGAEP